MIVKLTSSCFSTEECGGKPDPLFPGQTAFLVVQPRYMNVDIRVTVDVTLGALDLYMSPTDDTFIVNVNSSTGAHMVSISDFEYTFTLSLFYFVDSREYCNKCITGGARPQVPRVQ
jgi:hypothetical protein